MNADRIPGRFDGRSVLVVRARSPFGRAAVERFAAEGALTHAHEGDGADADERRSAVGAAVAAHGALDVVVVPPPVVPSRAFLEAGVGDHRAGVDAALRTTFFLAQEAARAMTGGGRICLVSPSRPAHIGPQMPAPATLVEGGLVALVRLLAVELASRRISVNALCPIASGADPGAVAAGLAFLASADASYVTGAFLPVLDRETNAAAPGPDHDRAALSDSHDWITFSDLKE